MPDISRVKINIVPSFHYDIAYLKTEEEYLNQCINNIHQILNIMDKYPEYTFTLEQVILLREYWNRYPENRNKLKKYVAQGRLCISPGMWAVPDMNMPDGESMFMQVKLGKDWLAEKFNINPDVCYIADCWGHHAQLPQIMRQAGYSYYIFWRCMRRDVMKNDFIWQGIDRTEIKTHWLARGYSGVSFPDEAEKVNVLDLDFVGSSEEDLIKRCEDIRQYGEDDDILIFNGGDFAYPQISAPEIVSKYNNNDYYIGFSTVKDHMDAVNWDNTEVFLGEFNTSQQGTFTTNILIKQTIRRLINKLHSLEKLSVITQKPIIDTRPIWENLLKQQFHDIICGSICDGAINDCYAQMREAEKQIFHQKEKLEDKDGTITLFNPLDIKKEEIYEYKGEKYFVECEPFGLFTPSEGKKIAKNEKRKLPCLYENRFYKTEIGENGFITSLIEKKSGLQITGSNEIGFGSISMQMDYGDVWLNFDGPISGGSVEASLTQNKRDPYLRGSKDDIVDRRTHEASNVVAYVKEENSYQLIIEQKCELNFWKIRIPITTQIIFSSHTPVIKYKTEFTPSGKNYRLRAAFPTAIESGDIRHEIAFGMQRRQQAEFPCQNFCDYSGKKHGLALINRGIPANNVDDDIMMLTLFRSVAMEYKTDSTLSYNEGRKQCFEYAVMPHATDCDSEIINHARMFNHPLELCKVSRNSESTKTVYTTNQSNIIVSGLRHQGEDIFIRLYEATGKKHTKCSLSLPLYVTHWSKASGIQKQVGDKKAIKDVLNLEFKPFEIKNILLFRQE